MSEAATLLAQIQQWAAEAKARSGSQYVDDRQDWIRSACDQLVAFAAGVPNIVERRSGQDRRDPNRVDGEHPMRRTRGARRRGGVNDSAVGNVVTSVGITNKNALPGMVATDTFQLQWVVLNDTSGTVFDDAVSFGTSDSGIATVSAGGLITAVGAGTATITVTTTGGVTDSIDVVVSASQTAASVVITSADPTITNGSTTVLAAEVRDAGGTALTAQTVTWSSGTTTVATVGADDTSADPIHRGTVTADAANTGTSVITATSGVLTDTATVTVQAPASSSLNPSIDLTGWLQVSDVTFDDVAKEPPISTHVWDSNRWQRAAAASRVSIQSLTTLGNFPAGPYGDLAWCGKICFIGETSTTPFRCEQRWDDAGTVYKKVYTKVWVAFQSNYDSLRTDGQYGHKWGFFRSTEASVPKTNHFWTMLELTTGDREVRIKRQWAGGTTDPADNSPFDTSLNLSFGQFYEIETYLYCGTAGANDGTWQVWVDGTLAISKTNFKMSPSDQPSNLGWRGLTWEPTYGGTRSNATYDSYAAVARWATYVSN